MHRVGCQAGLPAPERYQPEPGPFDIDALVEIAHAAPMLASLHDGLLQSCLF